MARYKLVKDEDLNLIAVLINDATHPTLSEGTRIPNDTSNRHWQEYLTWEESNDADAADTIDYMAKMRRERDTRMDAMQWRIQRNYRQIQNSETPTDDSAKMTAIYGYMKDLADMPQDNPNITTKAQYEALDWPSEPS